MPLQTLHEFIATPKWPWNAWVRYPGFDALYIRKNRFILEAVEPDCFWWVDRVVSIGNVTAKKPGKGAFTRLFHDLANRDLAIYVENVQTERFAQKLERLGFARCNWHNLFECYLFNWDGHLTKIERE